MGVYDYPFAGIQRTILHRICKSGFFWVVCAMYYDSAGGYANHEQLDQVGCKDFQFVSRYEHDF